MKKIIKKIINIMGIIIMEIQMVLMDILILIMNKRIIINKMQNNLLIFNRPKIIKMR